MSKESKAYKNMPKKVCIRTFGCQMNVRDSEVIRGLLTTNDYQLTTNEAEADIIIYNTCSVREHAENKVWSELGKYKRKSKVQSPKSTVRGPSTVDRKPIIGLAGCMAQNYKDEVFKRAPQVDFVVGPSDISKIPSIIKTIVGRQSTVNGADLYQTKIWETDGQVRPEEIYHTGFYEEKNHAYVVISEGCSNFCSYCVVPYVRGPLRNRDYREIIKEIEGVVDKGITNITLLGQNVNAYQSTVDGPPSTVGFVKLLELVNQIKGLKEFSFITSHPKDTGVDLFKAMRDLDKLKKYLHLPVQSGSNRILKAMDRGYTRKDYLALVKEYRKLVPEGVITTDIILGFPGETEQDFQDTYNLVKEVEFNAAFIFKYSTRPHTKAESMPDDVEKKEKDRRHQIVLSLQKKISRRKVEL